MGQFAAVYKRTTFTADPDPNSIFPSMPSGVVNASGGTEGLPFQTKETYLGSSSSALLMASYPSGSAAAFNTWIYEGPTVPNNPAGYSMPSGAFWVLMSSNFIVSAGAPGVIPNVRGNDYLVYIQLLSVSGAPQALLGYHLPQP